VPGNAFAEVAAAGSAYCCRFEETRTKLSGLVGFAFREIENLPAVVVAVAEAFRRSRIVGCLFSSRLVLAVRV